MSPQPGEHAPGPAPAAPALAAAVLSGSALVAAGPGTGPLAAAARTAGAAGLGWAGARLAYAGLRRWPPGGAARWERANHRGERLTLLSGPAVALAAAAAAAAAPGLTPRARAGLALAGIGAGAFGCYDDLAGAAVRRGFRGHLGALARGEVTTGAVKIAGIGATAAAAGALVSPAPADLVLATALIAGGANLANLFDLRPGRAIKVVLAAGLPLTPRPSAGPAAAAVLGAAAGLLPEDLGERAMLGDTGANALGAMLGATAALTLSRSSRLAALAVVAGLTGASEFVSFTAVIERTPPLRRLDMLGRRPPAGPK